MSPLGAEIRAMIVAEGPMSVEHFMLLALQHPTLGYYTRKMPFGRAGDFITAPDVSQMFGELIGLWAAQVWMDQGAPHGLNLVELGPGRGTMMADVLRATRVVPGFRQGLGLHLVETSPVLTAAQGATLAAVGASPTWHRSLETVPTGPAIILANEFFDALPVRHFLRGALGWHERQVGLDARGDLVFGAAAEPVQGVAEVREPGLDEPGRDDLGAILEIGHAARMVMTELATRIATQGGAILVCDYGHAETAIGETLQAMRGHAFVHPLADPGEADLTTHVDFAQLRRAAEAAGATVHGPVAQGAWLAHLGLASRAAMLAAKATPEEAETIQTAFERLTASSMATLFKVLAVTPPGAPPPPGFEV